MDNGQSPDNQSLNTIDQTPEIVPIPAETPPSQELPSTTGPQKAKSKKVYLLIILLIVIVGSLVAYFLLTNNTQKEVKQNLQSTTTPKDQTQAKKPGLPFNIAYSYATSEQGPYSLYSRPANGGDKTESLKLDKGTQLGEANVRGQQVIVSTQTGSNPINIWYSADGGKSYTSIFSEQKADSQSGADYQITSLIFSNDGKAVVFGYLPENGYNIVKQVSLDSSHLISDLFLTKDRGVFLLAYNRTTKQLTYTTGCYNCGGSYVAPDIVQTNTDTKVTKILVAENPDSGSTQRVANDDANELLLLRATKADSPSTFNSAGYNGPPYTLSKIDLNTGKETVVTTFGKKGVVIGKDKTYGDNITDTLFAKVAYMADGKTPYYFAGKQLFKVSGATPTLLFESTQPILASHYVSDGAIYVDIGTYNDFNLAKYDIATKVSKNILSGDSKTKVFGVTLK